jgi:hypothetical protein
MLTKQVTKRPNIVDIMRLPFISELLNDVSFIRKDISINKSIFADSLLDITQGSLNGYHEKVYPDGSKYCGEWKDGLIHGQGKLIDPRGVVKCEGIWAFDKFVSGRMVRSDSFVFLGEWADNLF